MNEHKNFSEREQREIIFEYETVNHVPEVERMTKWYTEKGVAVQKPYYKEGRTPISQSMIEQRCAEIVRGISPQELRSQFEMQYSEAWSTIAHEVVAQVDSIKNRAAEDMRKQKSPWGSWFARIAHPERPEDYIQIDITGYSTRNSVIESATVVMGGNVQDVFSLREMNAEDYMRYEMRDNTGFAQRVAEKTQDFDPSIQCGYQLFAPTGYGEHSLEEHYALLEQRGYDALPDYSVCNKEDANIYETLPFALSCEALTFIQNIIKQRNHEVFNLYRYKNMFKDPLLDSVLGREDYIAQYDKESGLFTLFDLGEELIAVISKDKCLYKEDIEKLMNEAGLEPTEPNFNRVWERFGDINLNLSLEENVRFIIQATQNDVDIKRLVVKDFCRELCPYFMKMDDSTVLNNQNMVIFAIENTTADLMDQSRGKLAYKSLIEKLGSFSEFNTEMGNRANKLLQKAKKLNDPEYLSKVKQYTIYQLRNDEALHQYHFLSLSGMTKFHLELNPDNYEPVYSGICSDDVADNNDILNMLYERFNLNHPIDYRAHSMSVSDVIVLSEKNKKNAYFVDSFGFQEVPAFIKGLEKSRKETGDKIENTAKDNRPVRISKYNRR